MAVVKMRSLRKGQAAASSVRRRAVMLLEIRSLADSIFTALRDDSMRFVGPSLFFTAASHCCCILLNFFERLAQAIDDTIFFPISR